MVGSTNGPAVLRGDGHGGFSPARHLAIGNEASGVPFEIGDLDADGRADLVVGHSTLEPGVGPSFDYLTVILNDSAPRADLAVSLAASASQVHVDEPLEWTITVANHGPEGASAVAVRDALRLGASYLSATASQGSCAQGNRLVSCNLGSMASGATATVTVRVSPTAVGTLWNTASANSATVDPGTADNGASAVATVVAASADLALAVADAPHPDTAGQNLTYTFIATNQGPSAASAVTLADPLPAGVTLVSATPSTGTCSSGSGTVTCSLGGLAPGVQGTVAIVVAPAAAGSLTNAALASADEADPDATNNAAAAQTAVQAAAQPPAPAKKGGCGCGASGPETALAAALLAVGRLLRRRSTVCQVTDRDSPSRETHPHLAAHRSTPHG